MGSSESQLRGNQFLPLHPNAEAVKKAIETGDLGTLKTLITADDVNLPLRLSKPAENGKPVANFFNPLRTAIDAYYRAKKDKETQKNIKEIIKFLLSFPDLDPLYANGDAAFFALEHDNLEHDNYDLFSLILNHPEADLSILEGNTKDAFIVHMASNHDYPLLLKTLCNPNITAQDVIKASSQLFIMLNHRPEALDINIAELLLAKLEDAPQTTEQEKALVRKIKEDIVNSTVEEGAEATINPLKIAIYHKLFKTLGATADPAAIDGERIRLIVENVCDSISQTTIGAVNQEIVQIIVNALIDSAFKTKNLQQVLEGGAVETLVGQLKETYGHAVIEKPREIFNLTAQVMSPLLRTARIPSFYSGACYEITPRVAAFLVSEGVSTKSGMLIWDCLQTNKIEKKHAHSSLVVEDFITCLNDKVIVDISNLMVPASQEQGASTVNNKAVIFGIKNGFISSKKDAILQKLIAEEAHVEVAAFNKALLQVVEARIEKTVSFTIEDPGTGELISLNKEKIVKDAEKLYGDYVEALKTLDCPNPEACIDQAIEKGVEQLAALASSGEKKKPALRLPAEKGTGEESIWR